MDGLNRFTDRECFDIDAWTVDFTGAGVLPGIAVDMRECDSICFFFKTSATWVPLDAVGIAIRQDTAVGGVEKDVYAIALIPALPNTIYAFEVKASDLDIDGGYSQARMEASYPGAGIGVSAAIGRLWGNFHRMPPACPTLGQVFDPEHTIPEEPDFPA